MAKNKEISKGDKSIIAVEEALTKTERFFEKNQKIILIVVGSIVVVVLGYFGYKKLYIEPKENEAQEQIWVAQRYFEQDSIDKAINGDGNNLGFLDIADDYGMTKSGNLAKYYLGICYLKKGNFQDAIDQLKSFDGEGEIVGPLATGAIGDAYMELGNIEQGVDYYLKAADQRNNDFTSTLFLFKAGFAYEDLGQYDKALEVYKKIQKEHYKSYEARDIEKYISRCENMIKK
jgi:tetratricopeptide (TPR) repeat protein